MKKICFLILISSNSALIAADLILKTSDNCEVSAAEKFFSTSTFAVLEVHGLGSNKEEWNKFNQFLESEKINWFAIDIRGHGNSRKCNGKEINYKRFRISDWQNIINDIKAAYQYLAKKISKEKIIFLGASLGANALLISAKELKPKKIILLSVGIEYAGIKAVKNFEKINSHLLFSSSPWDKYSYYSTMIFKDLCSKYKKDCYFTYPDSGHGVQIFDTHSGEKYAIEIIKWIKKN